MKVSVLVAVYKTDPAVLRDTIRSVLAQTCRDFELVILDDCPDDPREAVVREFDDERIVYERNGRNLGISATRNRLMEMARGEYLAVLDHDDICREDRLEKEVAYLDSHPECGAVSSFCVHFPRIFLSARPLTDRAIKLDLLNRCSMIHSASMLRASTLAGNGIRYEEEFSPSEDYRLFSRIAEVSSLACIPEPLLFYREGRDNTTAARLGEMVATARKARDAYRCPVDNFRPPRIVVSGGWSYGNLGDDAILDATARLLWRHLPEAEVAWTAYDVDFARESAAVPFDGVRASLHRFLDHGWSFWMLQTIGRSPGYALWPRFVRWLHAKLVRRRQMRRSLARDRVQDCSSLFKGADVYLMSGGGYFNQWPTKFDACLRELELAHENGCKVVIAGQSIGPFTEEQTSRLKAALRKDDVICVRDRESAADLEALGFAAETAPDLALAFPRRAKVEKGLIALGLGSHLDAGREAALADAIARIASVPGRAVRVRIVQTCRRWTDILSARSMERRLRSLSVPCETFLPHNYLELQAAIEGSEWVLSRRMHALIIGWRSGSRVIAITRSRKIDGLLEAIGSPAAVCPEPEWERLADKFEEVCAAEATAWEVREEVAARVDAAFAKCLEGIGTGQGGAR